MQKISIANDITNPANVPSGGVLRTDSSANGSTGTPDAYASRSSLFAQVVRNVLERNGSHEGTTSATQSKTKGAPTEKPAMSVSDHGADGSKKETPSTVDSTTAAQSFIGLLVLPTAPELPVVLPGDAQATQHVTDIAVGGAIAISAPLLDSDAKPSAAPTVGLPEDELSQAIAKAQTEQATTTNPPVHSEVPSIPDVNASQPSADASSIDVPDTASIGSRLADTEAGNTVPSQPTTTSVPANSKKFPVLRTPELSSPSIPPLQTVPQTADEIAPSDSDPSGMIFPATSPEHSDQSLAASLSLTEVQGTPSSDPTTSMPKEVSIVGGVSACLQPHESSASEQSTAQDSGSGHKDARHADRAPIADGTLGTTVREAPVLSDAFAVPVNPKNNPMQPANELPASTQVAAAPYDSSASPAPNADKPALHARLPSPPSSSFVSSESAESRFVNAAQLTEIASHSEMRVAMDTDKLGAIELRAHLVGNEVAAAITVERREAHAVLAVELPALQHALSEKQLRIEQVTLLHGSFNATAGDSGASARQHPRWAPRSHSNAWAPNAATLSSMTASGASENSVIFDSHGRLSVHA
jgi:Flagellar hook-length control protein FliK